MLWSEQAIQPSVKECYYRHTAPGHSVWVRILLLRPKGGYRCTMSQTPKPERNFIDSKNIYKHKAKKALQHSSNIDTRQELEPFKGQRLRFEGVLIDIVPPTRKTMNQCSLVFASLYEKNLKIELDHVVLQAPPTQVEYYELELYQRYYFTAEVGSYTKTVKLMGVNAQKLHFMLKNINMRKIRICEESHIPQPSLYIRRRVDNALNNPYRTSPFTKEELLDHIEGLNNDGSKEAFVETYTQALKTKHITRHEINKIIYQKPSDDLLT